MNLLVGLTVNKIEELLKTGEKIQAIKRVEDISGMAKIIKKVEKCFKKCFGNNGWMLQRIMKSFDGERPKKVWYRHNSLQVQHVYKRNITLIINSISN